MVASLGMGHGWLPHLRLLSSYFSPLAIATLDHLGDISPLALPTNSKEHREQRMKNMEYEIAFCSKISLPPFMQPTIEAQLFGRVLDNQDP